MIESYQDKVAYYISEKDTGLYNALNKGLKIASGDIVGILHSDDIYFNSEVIENIVNHFQSSDADVVYADGIFVNREIPSKIERIYKANHFNPKKLKWGWIPLHTTIYMKRNVINDVGLYDESYVIASDYDYSLKLFSKPFKFSYINSFVVKMRMGGKSTNLKLQKLKSLEDYSIIKRHQLFGIITLGLKVGRKVPQYIKPLFSKQL